MADTNSSINFYGDNIISESILFYFVAGSDYHPIGNQFVEILTTDMKSTKTIHIPIINDDIFEFNEELKVVMKFASPAPPGLVIEPAETTVIILDDDSKIFTEVL